MKSLNVCFFLNHINSIVIYIPLAGQRPRNKRDNRSISEQQLSKHVPAEIRHTTIQLQWKQGCFLRGPRQEVKKKTIGAIEFSCGIFTGE
jgi:hypothetical protein